MGYTAPVGITTLYASRINEAGTTAYTLAGNSQPDTYDIAITDETDTIQNGVSSNAGPEGQIDLQETTANPDDLWFSKSANGDDLIIQQAGVAVPAGESPGEIDVFDWFVNPWNQLADIVTVDGHYITASNVNTLVAAMATYSQANPGFSITASGTTALPTNSATLTAAVNKAWQQTITGTTPGQTLTGTTGSDTFTGDLAGDTLTGGAGQNTYDFAAGTGGDTITNFHAGSAGDTVQMIGAPSAPAISDYHLDDLLFDEGSASPYMREFGTSESIVGGGAVGSSMSGMHIAGVADVDGDGKSDVFWLSSTAGAPATIWEMNGSQVSSSVNLQYGTPYNQAGSTAWLGRFYGLNNGNFDVLYDSGSAAPFVREYTPGGNVYNGGTIGSGVAAGFYIAGVGDFDGDGKTDLLWLSTNGGAPCIWYMNGTSYTYATLQYGSPTSSLFFGDFYGDGRNGSFNPQTATAMPTDATLQTAISAAWHN